MIRLLRINFMSLKRAAILPGVICYGITCYAANCYGATIYRTPLYRATTDANTSPEPTPKPTAISSLSAPLLAQLSKSLCQAGQLSTDLLQPIIEHEIKIQSEPVRFRQTEIGTSFTVTPNLSDAKILQVQFLNPPGRPAQTRVTSFVQNTLAKTPHTEKPEIRLSLTSDCNISAAHKLVYDPVALTPLYVTALDNNFSHVGEKQWLNPEIPTLVKSSTDTIKVALVDSGVNYRLPEIAAGLATDSKGKLLGYDFWDMDTMPFDANPARSPFLVQRHGTRTASIVLREAPGVKLVPYRYPRNSMHRMTDLIQHASAHDIKVIGMPLGSNTYADWVDFETAARNHPHILFIVSAGNNGRDIDRKAVYPAAMDLRNMLVVTSADDFVHPAERTNYGRLSVDYLVPAEQIDAVDFSGETLKVAGSSYAVARVVALAARLLQHQPDQPITDIMDSIRNLSVRAQTSHFVSIGYLGDPLVSPNHSNVHVTVETTEPFTPADTRTTDYTMPLRLIRLDPRWNLNTLKTSLDRASLLYRRCGISLQIDSVLTLQTPDYLQDLSSGHAMTIANALKQSADSVPGSTRSETATDSKVTDVYLARDTIMLDKYDANAFGIGNTRNRPWMTNSLWITYGITDVDKALAHELFHIASNSGEHSTLPDNLMQNRTRPSNTRLTESQCATAIESGVANRLLVENF